MHFAFKPVVKNNVHSVEEIDIFRRYNSLFTEALVAGPRSDRDIFRELSEVSNSVRNSLPKKESYSFSI